MKTEEKLKSKIFNTEMEFDLTVDYSKSLDEMIKDGHYEYGDNSINSTNFPVIKPFGQTDDIVRVKAKILQFSGSCCCNFANEIKEIYKKGYRPANLAELLTFGKSHPLFQYQEQISCIGSLWYKKIKLLDFIFGSSESRYSCVVVSLNVSDLSRILKTHEITQNYLSGWKNRYYLAVVE